MWQRWWARALGALWVLTASSWGLGRLAQQLWRRLRGLGPHPRRGAQDGAALVGQTAVVEQSMVPGAQGQVALGGTVYLARNVGGASLPIGITCRITAIDHLTLWVNGDP